MQCTGTIKEALLEHSGLRPELRHQVELVGVHVDRIAVGWLAVQVHHRHLEQVPLGMDEASVDEAER